MTEEKERKEFPGRMNDEEIRQFVLDFVAGKIFTDRHVNDVDMLGMVFPVLALGGFGDVTEEEAANIGLIWEDINKAGPRSVNGMPMFLSCHLMHKDDFERARVAIDKELKRRKEIEV